MKCPNCAGQLGIEDEVCPYCGTPNDMAAKHQSDMARFQREYERTQADVLENTSFLRRQGSWLAILAVLLVALIVGLILQAASWDIGYGIRERAVASSAAEDRQVLDSYLEAGDYGKFLGYFDANSITLDRDNPYEGLRYAVYAYTDLIEYASLAHSESAWSFSPERIDTTCEYLAEDLNRIFTLEQHYSYDTERYLPADKRVYLDDIRDRAAAIAKAYFGLTDEQIDEIPNMSVKKLATLIEEGVSS